MTENNFNFADILKRNAEKISLSEEKKETVSTGSETSSESIETVRTDKKQVAKRTRNKSFNLRFSEDEFSEAEKKIKKSKLNRTDFILKCIREKEVIVIDDLTEILVEVRKQGININQIAKAVNGYYHDLKYIGLESYGMKEDLRKFNSELAKLQEENKKTLALLNKIFEKVV